MSRYCDYINKIKSVLDTEAATGGSLVTLLAGRVFWQMPDTLNEQLPCVVVAQGPIAEENAASSQQKDGQSTVIIRCISDVYDDAYPMGYVSGATDKRGVIRVFEQVANALDNKGGATPSLQITMGGTCIFFELKADPAVYVGGDDTWEIDIQLTGHLRFQKGTR